jgi:hypothetical protein
MTAVSSFQELAKQAHNSSVTQGSSMAYESLKTFYTLELFVKSSVLGGEKDQFQHSRGCNREWKFCKMKFLVLKLVFPPNFGGKLNFILSFLSLECVNCYYIYFHCCYLYNNYKYFRTLCIKCWVSEFHLRFNELTLKIPLKEGIGGWLSR